MALGRRKRNIFDPSAMEGFKLSRSKLEDFVRCKRCFYLDRRMGIGHPSIPAFTLNSAVDHLLKKEFDVYRAKGEPHPFIQKNEIDAVPFSHPELNEWRENFKGIQVYHAPTKLTITGAVDDVWVKPNGDLIVVDYKATSSDGEISLEDKWKAGFKRQMEIYQWLLRQKGFAVSNTGYFVYANARKDLEHFRENLSFLVTLISYEGNADWVEPIIMEAYRCLTSDSMPKAAEECEFCAYRQAARDVEHGVS